MQPYQSELLRIADSMEYADRDRILPIMGHILSKTEVELSLINAAMQDDKEMAIWLKERFRSDIEKLYQRLDNTLNKMDELASKL